MHVREWSAVRRRRAAVAVVFLALLVLAGVAVVRAVWPDPPPPIVSGSKQHAPAPADPDGEMEACTPGALDVRLAAGRGTFPAGQPVVFTVTLRNTGGTPCLVDGADGNRPVTVWAGEPGDAERVWSSGDCAGDERMLLLGPGVTDTQEVTWEDARSAPGCEQVRGKPGPGTYSARVTVSDVGGAASEVVQVTRSEPPKPSPSPSPSGSGGPSGSPVPSPSAPSPGPAPSTAAPSPSPRTPSPPADDPHRQT